jgi:hypothetical protein
MKKIIVDTKECTPFTLLCKEKRPGGRKKSSFLQELPNTEQEMQIASSLERRLGKHEPNHVISDYADIIPSK